jgi:hypothetical protein
LPAGAEKVNHITFIRAATGERRRVATGWSWRLFLLSGCFGIPLFLRGLALWGAVMAALCVFSLTPYVMPDGSASDILGYGFQASFFVASLWLGWKGNALLAKRLLLTGWDFEDLDSIATQDALARWGLEVEG